VNAMRFRRFICHLKHEMRTDKILLICDNASFHTHRSLNFFKVRKIVAEYFHLPPWKHQYT